MAEARDEYNRTGLLMFGSSMAFVFCFFIYIVAIHPGVDLKENPRDPGAAGAQEKAIAAVDVTTIKDPWVANEALVTHGQKVYGQSCAICHGNEGKGDGAAGQALNPKPRNLVEGPWKKGGGFTGLFTAISEGIPGSAMAGFAHLSTTDRWALVQFIDSITKAKVKADPKNIEDFAKKAK